MTRISYLFLRAKYSQEICPLIFQNSKIFVLRINDLSSSFINKNELSFLKNVSTHSIGSFVVQLMLYMYHYKLDSSLLNKFVFRFTLFLDLSGSFDFGQDDLFKSLSKLQMLRIRTQNAKNLLTRRNKWWNYLNLNVLIDPDDIVAQYNNQENIFSLKILQTFANVTYYDFPDQDLCHFKHFPHQRLVAPALKPIHKSSCSCTKLFLIQHSYKYAKYLDVFNKHFV